jgi:Toxin co-regulated pilus biosynthesis protein Q
MDLIKRMLSATGLVLGGLWLCVQNRIVVAASIDPTVDRPSVIISAVSIDDAGRDSHTDSQDPREETQFGDVVVRKVALTTSMTIASAADKEYRLDIRQSVLQNLSRWAINEQWIVVWSLDQDYEVQAPAAYRHSTFNDALINVLSDFRHQGLFLKATFYKANRTVVISK